MREFLCETGVTLMQALSLPDSVSQYNGYAHDSSDDDECAQ